MPELQPKITQAMRRLAYVEVVCGLPHDSIYIPGRGGRHCRYAGGFVEHRDSGLIIKAHECHLCNCFWLMKANTQPEKQLCDNCGGPAVPSGQPSCWPDLIMVDDFFEPRERR